MNPSSISPPHSEHVKFLSAMRILNYSWPFRATVQATDVTKDKLIGSGNIEFRGYNRSHILAAIGDATNKTRFEMIKGLVLKGNNKFNH